jgi:ubiquinone/menaquinone biosynthesis C-methylase UbiE
MRVLDVGCGTGTLLMLLSRTGAHAAGVDGDTNILEIARSKRARSDAPFALVAGLSDALPFPNSVFDRVFSTLMLHHLDDSAKIATLREVRRVLRPRGELHVADWGPPHTPLMRVLSMLMKALDGSATTHANITGRIPAFCRQAGFVGVEVRSRRRTPFGTLASYAAINP